MKDFYHYTLERHVGSILARGIYPDHPYFTTTEYYNAFLAGQELGVMAHNIECVLKFRDDGLFKQVQNVPGTNRFIGGGNQFQHPFRPKPVAVRKINIRFWTNL